MDNLFDKLQENALILDEEIPAGVQSKAERLESGDPDRLFEEVSGL